MPRSSESSAFWITTLTKKRNKKQVEVARPRKRGDANKLCHCASGKKYKKCCMSKDLDRYREAKSEDGAFRARLQAMRRAGIPESHIYAYRRSGKIINDINRDALPDHVVKDWDAAVTEFEERVSANG